jgi:hypothetical protein
MSKETKTEATISKQAWYKSALLPWAIIVILAVGFAGVVAGWTLRSQDISRVQAEAYSMVELSKTDEQK